MKKVVQDGFYLMLAAEFYFLTFERNGSVFPIGK